MTQNPHDYDISDAIRELRGSLYVIMQQVRLYGDVTMHEGMMDEPVSTRYGTFSAVMDYLAAQLQESMQKADALHGLLEACHCQSAERAAGRMRFYP